MAKVVDKEIGWLLKEKYHGKPSAPFEKDVERLKGGEPLNYVIGFTEFLGCRIYLSKRPLIPRPETEYWVHKAIEEMKKGPQEVRCLDLFSGSGCIGIAIARHIKKATMVFADKETKCLEQIKINAKKNHLHKKRYRVVQSDVFSGVRGAYDYIFTNPPYVAKAQKHRVQKSVLRYEPKSALFGGQDGLFYIRNFLAVAKNFLNPGGAIFMEFDSMQKRQIEALLAKLSYHHWQFHKDQYDKWRWVAIE